MKSVKIYNIIRLFSIGFTKKKNLFSNSKVIGSVSNENVWEDNRYTAKQFVESFVRAGNLRLKTLLTPDIVRSDEPNDVVIRIFKGKTKKSQFSIDCNATLIDF